MSQRAHPDRVVDDLPEPLRQAVAPLARVPFGLAVGVVVGALLLLLTGFHAVAEYEGENALFVWLLGDNFLPGVAPTPLGALAALVWGFAWGYALGWTAAFARNGFLSLCVRLIAWRERLRSEARVLDDLM